MVVWPKLSTGSLTALPKIDPWLSIEGRSDLISRPLGKNVR
jgi:hypothetical protein